MVTPATPQKPTYTAPPAGAVRTAQPGYTAITIKPPDRVIDLGGYSGQQRIPQPAYTMYLPPKQNLVSYPSWNGQKITVDKTLFPNAQPVQWTSGGQTVTIGLMFDNKDTGGRNFAYFGNGSNPTAITGGKLETIKPGTLITKYATDPKYSSTYFGTLDGTVAHSGNVPAWTLPIPYQVGGLNVYTTNPFQDPVTKIVHTKKSENTFAGMAEEFVESIPEWAPLVAFPLLAGVGAAGGFGALFASGTTAGLTGAGAGSAAGIAGGGLGAGTGALTSGFTGAPVLTGLGATVGTGAATATPSILGSTAGALAGGTSAAVPLATSGPQSVGGGTAQMLAEAGVEGYAPVSTATGSGFGAASSGGSNLLGGLAAGAGSASDPLLQAVEEAESMSDLGGATYEEAVTSAEEAIAELGGESVVGPALEPIDAPPPGGELPPAGGAPPPGGGGTPTPPGGGTPTPPGGDGGILDKIFKGDIAGIGDWILKNPDKALSVFGMVADLFSDRSPNFDLTQGTGVGVQGPGKGLPSVPPMNREVTPYTGDMRFYGTSRADPGPGQWSFFRPKPAGGAAAGGPIPGALESALPPRYFDGGPGGGQDDLIDAKLSPGEFVFDASTVSDLGDGNNDEGARRLERMVQQIRLHKRGGRRQLPPRSRAPLDYLRGG